MKDGRDGSPIRSGADAAERILADYRGYRVRYQAITAAARDRFENAEWHSVHQAGVERLTIYGEFVRETYRRIRRDLGPVWPEGFWRAARSHYRELISGEYSAELFETYYNSVYREATEDGPINDSEMFMTGCFPEPPVPAPEPLLRDYRPDRRDTAPVVAMMKRIAADVPLGLPWQDLDRDIRSITRSLVEERIDLEHLDELSIEILRPLFFRNKGAYLVGRLRCGRTALPIALPILRDPEGRLYIDTLICDEDELSIMFSFTRAYFMVLTATPTLLVDYLNQLMPNKKRAELFATIGLHKHGKTVFYREFLAHLASSEDAFVIAPGIRGMVMAVFLLESYKIVFKVIKDRFAPQKQMTEADVRDKYHMVKRHDRVGRMADTQEFQNLALPLARFDPELLEELQEVAASKVRIEGDQVIISHLYTERMMTPLNLYIASADDRALESALDEYGNAIKQLAAANIFPGDMLLKNFGITRHGRVVFYDYDEICYLDEVNFRDIPEPQTPEQEMAAEPWYSVGPDDVFPEEFSRFLFGRPGIKATFRRLHGDLFDPEYWRGVQRAIAAGRVMDVYPYRRKKRFRHRQQPPA